MRFDYLRPASLGEATAFLAQEAGAQPLAGGTDLFPRIKDRLISPKYVVSLKGLPELQGMGPGGGGWRLGALTAIRAVETSPQVRQLYPILSQAAGTLGSVQVRNVATVGGNLCHAVPSADMAPALLALDAQATLVGPQGKRSLPLEKFFLGPRLTALQPGELLMEVVWPPLPSRWGGCLYQARPSPGHGPGHRGGGGGGGSGCGRAVPGLPHWSGGGGPHPS